MRLVRSGGRAHGRKLLAVAATLGVGLATAACGVSEDAPRPGVAADVDGEVLTLGDLGALVDAACISAEADENAQGSARADVETQLLQSWVVSLVLRDLGEEAGVSTNGPSVDTDQVPGWDDMTPEGQEMVADYFALQRGASAVFQQIGEDAPVGDLDVEFNPRFDVALGEVSVVGDLVAEGGGFVPADGQLSVASTDVEATDPAAAAELPDSQYCGPRPAEGA